MSKVTNAVLLCAALTLCAAPQLGCSGSDFQDDPPPLMDGTPGDGAGSGEGGTLGDGGGKLDTNKPPANPYDPKNGQKDTDCDGINDKEEFSIVYGGGKQTSPQNPDTDGDGVKDGVEVGRIKSVDPACGYAGDADPKTKTIPTVADTDADGRKDGEEDTNGNGKLEPSETDPLSPDTDGDGLKDGAEGKLVGGKVGPAETDPRKADTDADKINDGVEKSTTKTDPTKADTDGDGCKDGDEDTNQNGKVDPGETNPLNKADCGSAPSAKDSDKDGLPDAYEDKNKNYKWEPNLGETNWNNPDTDGDGLMDGVEDANKDGKLGANETNPLRKDTDCDGLIDGPDKGAIKGEDQNANGAVDAGETDPRAKDTDKDGITDGVERQVTVNPDPLNCKSAKLDADPSTKTDPTKADTDGDGIEDGSEDANQNGKVDPGELDPNNPGDATGPVAMACKTTNLVQVLFRVEAQPDISLALPQSFKQLTPMTAGGKTVGLMGYDATRKVAFLVYRAAAPGGATSPSADEAALRTKIASTGAVSNATTQTFSSWDGHPALQATYDQAGGVDLKARANALAVALAGAGTGVLTGTAGVNGPFKLQAEYVHRSNASVVVLVALTPMASFVEPTIFTVGDLAGGSALAQFGDTSAVQCEKFTAGTGSVDFLFVVDNSGSMSSHQTALANSGNAMASSLNNSSLDWRIAMVTTNYPGGYGQGSGVLRGFTRNIKEFQGWLTKNNNCVSGFCSLSGGAIPCSNQDQCWVTTSGSASEKCLESAAKAVSDITPGTATEVKTKARAGAKLVVIILGDADDQSTYGAAAYSNFFSNANASVGSYQNKSGDKVPVHGIICPAGQTCGETQKNPQWHGQVITATGGVRGAINTPAAIAATMNQIVQSTIGAAGYKTKKPPIGTSIKIALAGVQNPGQCNKNNVPRSRVNGFDFDGLNRTVSLYGACRPAGGQAQAAISYRYWVDGTPNPDANKLPCEYDPDFDPTDSDYCKGKLVCNKATDICECPPNCGGVAPPGKVCNTNKQVCDFVCTPDCGGTCKGYYTCDVPSCSCKCVTSATCAPGYVFSPITCSCVCDTTKLSCGSTYQADTASCSCLCKPACGGCPSGKKCVISKCACEGEG
jgi:hypothetical protein